MRPSPAPGAVIILRRIEAVHEIEKLAARIHRDLTHGAEVLRIHYHPAYDPLPSPDGQIAMPLKTTVQRNGFTEDDIRQGFSVALKANRRRGYPPRCDRARTSPGRVALPRQRDRPV